MRVEIQGNKKGAGGVHGFLTCRPPAEGKMKTSALYLGKTNLLHLLLESQRSTRILTESFHGVCIALGPYFECVLWGFGLAVTSALVDMEQALLAVKEPLPDCAS